MHKQVMKFSVLVSNDGRDLRLASPCNKPPRILSWDTSESCLTFTLSVTGRANEYQFASIGNGVLYYLLNDRKYAAFVFTLQCLKFEYLHSAFKKCFSAGFLYHRGMTSIVDILQKYNSAVI